MLRRPWKDSASRKALASCLLEAGGKAGTCLALSLGHRDKRGRLKLDGKLKQQQQQEGLFTKVALL